MRSFRVAMALPLRIDQPCRSRGDDARQVSEWDVCERDVCVAFYVCGVC